MNFRLGLCNDEFNPNNSDSIPLSLWFFLCSITYLHGCVQKTHLFKLCLVIPGWKSPGQNLDVFLRPLIDELKFYTMKALKSMITIVKIILDENYPLMSVQWLPCLCDVAKLKHAWPLCLTILYERQRIPFDYMLGKPSWFDCHQTFTSVPPIILDKIGFWANKSIPSSLGPPLKLNGCQIYKQVFNIPPVYEDITHDPNNKHHEFGKTHYWLKKNIFGSLNIDPCC